MKNSMIIYVNILKSYQYFQMIKKFKKMKLFYLINFKIWISEKKMKKVKIKIMKAKKKKK